MSHEAHKLLAQGLPEGSPLREVYRRRCRQVAELLTRLRAVDGDWARVWEAKEKRNGDA